MEVTSYRMHLGDRAPPFDLPGVDGKGHGIRESDGKPLVVAFWCNHCPYVRKYERRFVDWARDALAKGVAVVAVSSNDPARYPQDDFEHMVERAKEQDYPFPYLFDATQDVARAYGAQVTPHFFVFTADRTLVYQGRFDSDMDAPEDAEPWLPQAVDALLAGERIPKPETKAIGCSVKWKE